MAIMEKVSLIKRRRLNKLLQDKVNLPDKESRVLQSRGEYSINIDENNIFPEQIFVKKNNKVAKLK
jgi:hypothetical protein